MLRQRLSELYEMLTSRHYNENLMNLAIEKALTLSRTGTLKRWKDY
jgi:hypothetical protein